MASEDDLVEDGKAIGLLIEEGASWYVELCKNSKDLLEYPLDHLSLALHGLMLELGFQSHVDKTQAPPPGWKSPLGHSVRYHYPPDTEDNVVLTLTTLGPVLKVLGTHTAAKVSFSTVKVKQGFESPEKLSLLARTFKTEVGGPLLNVARERLGLPLKGFLGLPPELLLRILSKVDALSLCRLARVSKNLNLLARDQALWKMRYLKDFGERNFKIKEFNRTLEHKGEPEDWREVYREQHVSKLERERELKKLDTHLLPNPRAPLFPFPDPTAPIDPLRPPIPGMIGGDYDRIPLFGGHTLRPTNFLPPRPRFDPPGPNFGGGRGGAFGGFL